MKEMDIYNKEKDDDDTPGSNGKLGLTLQRTTDGKEEGVEIEI
jgi:hypothetical protein